MRLIFSLLSFLALAATTATAQEYKCQNGGKVYYAQYPCPGNEAKEAPRPVYAPVPRAPVSRPSSSQAPTESPIAKQSTAMIAAALAGGDFAKAERLAVTKEQWDMIAAAKRRAAMESSGAEARTRYPAQDQAIPQGGVPSKYENEKVMTRGGSGWDNKTRGQSAVEQSVRAGQSTQRTGAAWEDEKVLQHGSDGWSKGTRYDAAVKRGADLKAQDEANAAAAARGNGTVTTTTGRTCVMSGGVIVSCN